MNEEIKNIQEPADGVDCVDRVDSGENQKQTDVKSSPVAVFDGSQLFRDEDLALMSAHGYDNAQVGAAFGLSAEVVGRILAKPEVQEKLTKYKKTRDTNETVNSRLENMQEKALTVIEKILDDPDAQGRLKLNAAEGVLDRMGLRNPNRLDFNNKKTVDVGQLSIINRIASVARKEGILVETQIRAEHD